MESMLPLLLVVGMVIGVWKGVTSHRWRLAPSGCNQGPAATVVLWILVLNLALPLGSLELGVLLADVALMLTAAWLLSRRSPGDRAPREPWTVLDWAAFAFIAYALWRVSGNDNVCHQAVTNTMVRGNVPPTQLNNPNLPLLYHPAINAVAATLVKGFGLTVEDALDVVMLVLVWCTMDALKGLTHQLFSTTLCRQWGRLLFLFGMGPTHPALWRDNASWLGHTVQPYVQAIFRRPTALNFLLFVFLLNQLLPWVARNGRGSAPRPGPALLFAVPALLLLPLTSEDLTFTTAVTVAVLVMLRMMTWQVGLVVLGALGVALPLGGFFQTHLHATFSGAHPSIVPAFPPSLPWWTTGSVVVFSREALAVYVFEWGPVFFLGLLWPFFSGNRPCQGLAIFVMGTFGPAVFLDVEGWPPNGKSDLDRFLFYGTALGFMMAATPLERWALGQPGASSRTGRMAAAWALVCAVMAPSLWFVQTRATHQDTSAADAQLTKVFQQQLQSVGPRELILTKTPTMAEGLVASGFIVAAPMPSSGIGRVDEKSFAAYVSHLDQVPAWLFYPRDDPRVAGLEPVARVQTWVLVRNPVAGPG